MLFVSEDEIVWFNSLITPYSSSLYIVAVDALQAVTNDQFTLFTEHWHRSEITSTDAIRARIKRYCAVLIDQGLLYFEYKRVRLVLSILVCFSNHLHVSRACHKPKEVFIEQFQLFNG